jgi:hypothetical protein
MGKNWWSGLRSAVAAFGQPDQPLRRIQPVPPPAGFGSFTHEISVY